MNVTKSLFVLVVSGTLSMSLSAQSQIVKDYYPSGELMSEGNTVDVNCSPNLVQYNNQNPSQNIPSDQEVVNNSGNSGSTCTVKDGVWKNYYKSGQVAVEANYSSGVKTSIWKKYDEQGNLTEEIDYDAGEATFYYSNGQISQQGKWTSGNHKDGSWKGWYEDGSLMYEGEFSNGATINIQHYPTNH